MTMQLQLVAEIKDGEVLRKPSKGLILNKIKIRYGKNFRIELVSELLPDDNEIKMLKSIYFEQPRAEFDKALGIILRFIISRCKLNAEEWGESKITEVSLKETEDGVNVVVVASIENGVDYKVHVRLEQENIGYELKSKIDNLIAEVEDFVGGKRRQGNLFEQEEM